MASETDLLARTAELVDIASVSHQERALVDHLEAELTAIVGLRVDRVGDNLVARTDLGRPHRVILGGHSDTVPPNGNEAARIEGDTLWGLGSTDMKGALAVMVELARTLSDPAVDVTYVIYAREEIAGEFSGLGELFELRPELLAGDVAILGEPTDGLVEPGCQGAIRIRLTLAGARAHTARAWMGRNAIHRLAPILGVLERYEPRTPTIQGCSFHEGLQAVFVDGGVAGNVVPDAASITVHHRFAPDHSADQALAHLHELFDPHLDEGDRFEVLDVADAAPPGLDHPVLATLVGRNDLEVRAKLGWTDVARFAAHGVPAANFGPGDALLAHTAEERLERRPLESSYAMLHDLLANGPD